MTARLLRGFGWTLITLGAHVLLYLFWSMVWTNGETDAAQRAFLDEWEATAPTVEPEAQDGDADAEAQDGDADAEAQDGDADAAHDSRPVHRAPPLPEGLVAALSFHRPGSAERPVTDETVFVVHGTDREALKSGPGHYTDTVLPGEEGNFGVAGHRTTYGAPFFRLDDLVPGDEVEVVDAEGTVFTYRVVDNRVVAPDGTWVLGDDPLGLGVPMLTLTTCHPRFSARERLIVFAELVT